MFFRKQKPAGNDNRLEPANPTLIGAGTSLTGHIDSDGEVRIEGSLSGTIRARSCVVAAGGSIEGEIEADDIIVQGRVKGPLRAQHVHLQDGASVEGDITSNTIGIDTGARLSGAVWQVDDREQRPTLSASGQDRAPSLFSSSLWEPQDEYRPIQTVRPRLNGTTR